MKELIMELADSYAQEAKDFGHLSDSVPRKALQDALERLTAERDLLKEVTELQVENYAELKEQYDAMHGYFNSVIAERDALEAARAELALAKEVMAHDREYIDELLGKLK